MKWNDEFPQLKMTLVNVFFFFSPPLHINSHPSKKITKFMSPTAQLTDLLTRLFKPKNFIIFLRFSLVSFFFFFGGLKVAFHFRVKLWKKKQQQQKMVNGKVSYQIVQIVNVLSSVFSFHSSLHQYAMCKL